MADANQMRAMLVKTLAQNNAAMGVSGGDPGSVSAQTVGTGEANALGFGIDARITSGKIRAAALRRSAEAKKKAASESKKAGTIGFVTDLGQSAATFGAG